MIALTDTTLFTLPVHRWAYCGSGPAESDDEASSLERILGLDITAHYVTRIVGTSMTRANLYPNMWAICERVVVPDPEDIIHFLLDGDVMIKRYCGPGWLASERAGDRRRTRFQIRGDFQCLGRVKYLIDFRTVK